MTPHCSTELICNNDAVENQAYINDHFHLKVSPETQLGAWLKRTAAGRRNQASDQAAEAGGYHSEARWFIDILKHSGWDLGRIHLFVFHICAPNADRISCSA